MHASNQPAQGLGKPNVEFQAFADSLGQTTHFGSRRVVNYKALAHTTAPRNRVRKARPATGHDARPGQSPGETRRLLARELHDSVAQTLSSMLLDLDSFRAEQHGRAGVLRQLDQLEQSTRQALTDLRGLLVELRADRLGEEDLVRLVKHGMLERQGRRRLIEYELTVAAEWPEQISAHAASELNRIVQEAIENGIRHSGARKIVVTLNIGAAEGSAVLTIGDDGRGLPSQDDLSVRAGLGILGMRERASLLGGEVQLEDGPGARGTTVRVTIPLGALFSPASKA